MNRDLAQQFCIEVLKVINILTLTMFPSITWSQSNPLLLLDTVYRVTQALVVLSLDKICFPCVAIPVILYITPRSI